MQFTRKQIGVLDELQNELAIDDKQDSNYVHGIVIINSNSQPFRFPKNKNLAKEIVVGAMEACLRSHAHNHSKQTVCSDCKPWE